MKLDKGEWIKGVAHWRDEATAYISIAFTWRLSDAEKIALVPPGWQLVPKEPTEAMIDAHFAAHAQAKTVFAEVPAIYRAMLSAAPPPPEKSNG